MSYDYYNTLDSSHQELYDRKLSATGVEMCIYRMPEDSWCNNPGKWPQVEYGDIYCYLIDFPRLFSREKMKNYKSLEAHSYFQEGWVQTIFHITNKNQVTIFKTKVKPSQRVTEEPHQPWVAVNKSGTVLTGHCTCMAGVMIETPGKVGDTMVGEQISKVIETRNKDFPVGTIVRSQSGWRSHTIITSDQAHRMPELHDLPLSTALGVMGMPGIVVSNTI